MAKGTNKSASMFVNMAMILSLFLVIAMAEGRSTVKSFRNLHWVPLISNDCNFSTRGYGSSQNGVHYRYAHLELGEDALAANSHTNIFVNLGKNIFYGNHYYMPINQDKTFLRHLKVKMNGLTFCFGFQTVKSTLECNAVTSVVSGDTCAALAQSFGLTATSFASINPNLNCDKLFVGQWICVDGTTA